MEKAEDKEGKTTVHKMKAKEENLEVAGAKCWRGKWLSVLRFTGKIFKNFPNLQLSKLRNQLEMCHQQKEIFLRDLDPSLRRPFCYGGLCNPGHCLLQL